MSIDGGPETPFANAPEGSKPAPWIGDSVYEFRLYAGTEHMEQLASVRVTRAKKKATLTANPNPILVADPADAGITTLSWTIEPEMTVEVHVGQPDGALLTGPTTVAGSAATGKWVTDGAKFYLQNVTGGRPLTAENTLSIVTVDTKVSGAPGEDPSRPSKPAPSEEPAKPKAPQEP